MPERSTSAPSNTQIVLVTHDGKKIDYRLPKANRRSIAPTITLLGGLDVGSGHRLPAQLQVLLLARAGAQAVISANSYPAQFTPLFHHERLDAPANSEIPEQAAKDSRLGRVFVCSMADLYGKWVPEEWIEQIHKSCIDNPQWEYLMLTKFPQRYASLQLPPTAWIGTTVDEQYRVRSRRRRFARSRACA